MSQKNLKACPFPQISLAPLIAKQQWTPTLGVTTVLPYASVRCGFANFQSVQRAASAGVLQS